MPRNVLQEQYSWFQVVWRLLDRRHFTSQASGSADIKLQSFKVIARPFGKNSDIFARWQYDVAISLFSHCHLVVKVVDVYWSEWRHRQHCGQWDRSIYLPVSSSVTTVHWPVFNWFSSSFKRWTVTAESIPCPITIDLFRSMMTLKLCNLRNWGGSRTGRSLFSAITLVTTCLTYRGPKQRAGTCLVSALWKILSYTRQPKSFIMQSR